MTYGDIIEWIEENYDFEPNEDARAAFNQISEDWKEDNRDTLANTLGDESEPFIERIRDLISEAPEDFTDLEQRVDTIEQGLGDIFTEFGQVIRGRESVVLPKGYVAIEPNIIAIEEIQDENILTKAFNFIKRLFS